MIKVAYTHDIFFLQKFGGISRYFSKIIPKLGDFEIEPRIFAPIYANRYVTALPPKFKSGLAVPRYVPYLDRLIPPFNNAISGVEMSFWKPGIVHESYFSSTPIGPKKAVRVLTVYDMIHELYPQYYAADDPTSRNKRIAAERADHIFSISENTKKDLVRFFNIPESKVTVVYLAADPRTENPTETTNILKHGSKPFLLFVGERARYKNFDGFLKAFASELKLKQHFNIVAFGGGRMTSDEKKLVESLGFTPNQVLFTEGSDQLLRSYYSTAAAFIYPSQYEGFGLPPLEAMAFDCPIVCSNTSSIPEVIGDAGEYFDPLNQDEMVSAICRVVFSDSRRQEIIAAGKERLALFTWEKCARETAGIYKNLI